MLKGGCNSYVMTRKTDKAGYNSDAIVSES